MLTEFDQTTIANMTAALDYVSKKIPADKDTNELRKRIGDELVQCARMGRRSLIELQKAGMKVMEETAKPNRSGWFGWRWRTQGPDRITMLASGSEHSRNLKLWHFNRGPRV
jgi:hypothetical protein